LDLRLDILNAVRWFHLEGDGLSGQGFDEDLHSTTEAENQMKGGLFLDIVIRKSTTIFQLLARENQPLLVRGNSFLVLDLSLDVLDAIGRFDLEGDGLPREGFDEDLHRDLDSVVRDENKIDC